MSRLTEAIVGEPIQGSWWAHPQSHRIYAILEAVCDCEDVLVCRLIDDKITLVHRRLWVALVRLAGRFTPRQLARVRQEHTATGRHVNQETAFAQWVPAEVAAQALSISEPQALALFGGWTPPVARAPQPRPHAE